MEDSTTCEDAVSHTLAEASLYLLLREFVTVIAADPRVAQVDVHQTKAEPLEFIVHSAEGLDTGLRERIDTVEVNGRLHRFKLTITAYGPPRSDRIHLYDKEAIFHSYDQLDGSNPYLIERQVQELEQWLNKQLAEHGESE